MDSIRSTSGLVVFGNSLYREGYASYPVFSLKVTDIDMLEETRKILQAVGAEFQEIELPGFDVPEIGFAIQRGYITKFDFFEPMSDDLREQLTGWATSPQLTAIPYGVAFPWKWLPNAVEVIDTILRVVDCSGIRKRCLFNVETDEVAQLTLNHDNKTYQVDRDISGWRHAVVLSPDFVRAQQSTAE